MITHTPSHIVSVPRRRGFTLAEVVVAIGISSVLFLGLGSAVLMASRALPQKADAAAMALEAGTVANTLADDLRYALTFSAMAPTDVEFTVPDRTGDAVPEDIRYEWSGVVGDPLRRQVNGGSWTTVVPSVKSFALDYNNKTVATTKRVTTETTSPEVLFAYFNGWPSVPSPSINSTSTDATSWGAEFFTIDQVTLPTSVRRVQITRVRLMLKKVAASGTVTVGIHRSVGGGNADPAASPLGTPGSVAVSSLPAAFGWVDVAMPPDVSINQLSKEFVIVAKGTVSNCAEWQMLSSTSAPKDSTPTGLWTTNGGGQWQPNKSSQYKQDHQFYVYGTYTSSNTANVTTSTSYLQSVGVSLESVGATGTQISTAVDVLGQPQVTP